MFNCNISNVLNNQNPTLIPTQSLKALLAQYCNNGARQGERMGCTQSYSLWRKKDGDGEGLQHHLVEPIESRLDNKSSGEIGADIFIEVPNKSIVLEATTVLIECESGGLSR